MKFFMKGRLKKWRENPQTRKWKPYFPFAEDIQVEAEVIGRTALDNEEELIAYCATLTTILQNKMLEINETQVNNLIPNKIDLETTPYTYIQQEDVASRTEHERSTEAILCR
jgi:hypothetical protein